MKALSALIIVSLIALSGCGKEEKENGMLNSASSGEVSSELKGDWIAANLADGAENPTATACTAKDANSYSVALTIADKLMTKTTTHFVGATDCTGADKVTVVEKIGFVGVETNGHHIMQPRSYQKTATVATVTAAAALNAESACGQTDWSAKEYAKDAEHLTACTDDNDGAVMTRHVDESVYFSLIYKIAKQGNGLSTSFKPAILPEVDYVQTEHFAPKP